MSSQGSLWHSRAHKLQSQLFPTLTVSVIGMASIRPSIFYTHLSWAGRASAHIWRRALGYSTSVTGLTRIAFTNYVQFKVSNSPELHVLGLWEETGAPGRNPHRTQFRSQVPPPLPLPPWPLTNHIMNYIHMLLERFMRKHNCWCMWKLN